MIVTKKGVTKTDFGYIITVNVVVKEGETELLNEDFSQNHNRNNNLNVAMTELKTKMKARIATYKDEVAFLGNSTLDTAITVLETEVNK